MYNNKTIVITGSFTGIGKACALHLDKIGFKVYAGVRKQADGDILKEKASDKLSPIILDVTDAEFIADAVSIIEKGNDGEVLYKFKMIYFRLVANLSKSRSSA